MRSNFLKAGVLLMLAVSVGGVQAQTLRTVALSNDPITEAGVTFQGAYATVINDVGETATRVFTGGIKDGYGIWSEGGGDGKTYSASVLSEAPGIASGTVFDPTRGNPFFWNVPLLNDAGKMAFIASFLNRSATTEEDYRGTGIWTEDGGNGLELVARTGGVAPGTDPGAFFSSLGNDFGNFAFNNAGQAAFLGKLSGTGVTEDFRDEIGIRDNEVGIWSEGGGNGLQLVARSGNSAPGAEPDEFFKIVQ